MEAPFDRGEVDRASLDATERLRARLSSRPASPSARPASEKHGASPDTTTALSKRHALSYHATPTSGVATQCWSVQLYLSQRPGGTLAAVTPPAP
jgi:hypothetical protein